MCQDQERTNNPNFALDKIGVWSWLLFPTGIASLRVEVETRAMGWVTSLGLGLTLF